MSRVDEERDRLRSIDRPAWRAHLVGNSGLPGPRANLALAEAAAQEGDLALFTDWITVGVEEAPENTPGVIVPSAAALGLGRLLAEGDVRALPLLHDAADDPRWRVRECVAEGLSRLGRVDFAALRDAVAGWPGEGPLHARAAVAALADPPTLSGAGHVAAAVPVLEAATDLIRDGGGRRDDAHRALRKALGYAWSVLVAADPDAAGPAFTRLTGDPDRDVRWVVRENLRKERLRKAVPSPVLIAWQQAAE